MFKIATWNVNSLRVRLPHVLQWLESESPDVLAIQETKTTDEKTATDDKNDIANDKTNTIVDIYEKEVKEDEDEVIIIKGI